MGFEPTRAEHNGLAVHRLNHSATSSWMQGHEIGNLKLKSFESRMHTWCAWWMSYWIVHSECQAIAKEVLCMLLALHACLHINENTARPKTWNTFSCLSCISIARKVEIVRQKSGHAVTRIRTWVVTATTWSTNHYTITARK